MEKTIEVLIILLKHQAVLALGHNQVARSLVVIRPYLGRA